MAYVLIAVGALMAAAGLYVIGYSALNTRFEEYWASMTAGSTLVAGGVITVAIGIATRALRDLKAALSSQAVAFPTATPAAIEPPTTLSSSEPDHLLERSREIPATASSALPPVPPQLETEPTALIETPTPTYAAEPHERPAALGTPPSVAAAYEPAVASRERVSRDLVTPAEPLHSEPEHPREDEVADAPSASSDMRPEPTRRPASPARTPEQHQMPDDWLDRAFADLDQELPISAPAPRSPPVPPYRQDIPVKTEPHPLRPTPSAEPAHAPAPELAAAPSTDAAPSPEDPTPAPPTAPDTPTSAVIGRYEADGTSYVMYADGSIEAQSSAGVYRFSSMAELKSFIES